ncbi:MAG: hypothetical protein GWP91_00520 [Rhodobacterales bacterium]|nr:hypothetical protein [Rhodobacterales bacterium]
MATFETELDDDGEVLFLMEAETTGAFSKSSAGETPRPHLAFKQAVNAIGMMGNRIATSVGPNIEGTGMQAAITFGIKIDASGQVMIASDTRNCQFSVQVIFKP